MRNVIECPSCQEKLALEPLKIKLHKQESKTIQDHMFEEKLNRLAAQMNSQHALINGLMSRIDSLDTALKAEPLPTPRVKPKYTRKKKRLGRPRKSVK